MHTKKVTAAFLVVAILVMSIAISGTTVASTEEFFDTTENVTYTSDYYPETSYYETDYPVTTGGDYYWGEGTDLSLEIYEVTADKLIVDLYVDDWYDIGISGYNLTLENYTYDTKFISAEILYDCDSSFELEETGDGYDYLNLVATATNDTSFPHEKTALWRIEYEIVDLTYLNTICINFDDCEIKDIYGYYVGDVNYDSLYYEYDFLPKEHTFEIEDGVVVSYDGPGGVVTIPDGVTGIGWAAFGSKLQIQEVIIPEGVTYIDFGAFQNCHNLTTVTLPESLTAIYSEAFWHCRSLKTIYIPDSVTTISYGIFTGCNITIYCSIGSAAASYAADYDIPVIYTDTVTELTITSLPTQKTYAIGELLKTNGLELSITFDNGTNISLTSGFTVGEYDFSTEGTKTITVYYGDKSVNFEVYVDPNLVLYPESEHPYPDNCYETWEYTHPTEADYLKVTFSPDTKIDNSSHIMIEYCDANGNYVYNFYFETDLAGETVIIGSNSFEITLETNDVYNYYGFSITNIEGFMAENGFIIEDGTLTRYIGNSTDVVIPDSVHTVGNNAFEYNSYMVSVTIPDSVEKIGEYAFHECYNLATINITDNVKYIGCHAFENTAYDYQTRRSDGMYVGNHLIYAYPYNYENDSYESCEYVIKEGTITIAEYAFRRYGNYAEYFTKITIPDSVKYINDCAFGGCYQLTEITIPESVESIGNWAFEYCNNLSTINISHSLKHIGRGAFDGTAYYYDENNRENSGIYVGSNLVASGHYLYGDTLTFEEYTTIKDGTVTLADYSFHKAWGIKELFVPKSVQYIGEGSFVDCVYQNFISTGGLVEKYTTILCYKDSATHKYCVENDIPYELVVCDEHTETELVGKIDATCTTDGYTGDTVCNECGTVVTAGETVPITDHTPGEWEIITEATETTEGLRVRKCSVCDKELEREVIPVVVPSYMPGNVNDDGNVNLSDVTLLLQYIAKWNVTINTDAADVNDDNSVNLSDVTLVLQYIAKWDVTLK